MDSCFAVHRDGRDFKCGTMLTIPVLVGYSEVIPPPADSIAGPDAPKAIWERPLFVETAHRSSTSVGAGFKPAPTPPHPSTSAFLLS